MNEPPKYAYPYPAQGKSLLVCLFLLLKLSMIKIQDHLSSRKYLKNDELVQVIIMVLLWWHHHSTTQLHHPRGKQVSLRDGKCFSIFILWFCNICLLPEFGSHESVRFSWRISKGVDWIMRFDQIVLKFHSDSP